MREQDGWDEHARFMDALVDEGSVLLGGPVGKGDSVLQVWLAEDEHSIRKRLADDPWHADEHLGIDSIEPWEVLLDGTR